MSNTKKIKTKKKKKEEEKVDAFTQSIRDNLNSMGRKVDPYQEKILVQLLKAFLVGGLTTILDFILYCVLSLFLSPLLGNLISMMAAIALGIVIGVKYVYDLKSQKKELRQYFILSCIGFLLTEGMIYGLVISIHWNAILVKILAIILVIVMKILVKRFLFSKQKISK